MTAACWASCLEVGQLLINDIMFQMMNNPDEENVCDSENEILVK